MSSRSHRALTVAVFAFAVTSLLPVPAADRAPPGDVPVPVVAAADLGLRLGGASAPTPTPPAPSGPSHPSGPRASSSGAVKRFWVNDRHRYRSRWYAGAHRKMIAFGCTPAPYYDPDPRCTAQHGFHHGLDIAMPCGNPLYAGYRARVVAPGSAGSLGDAYGPWAFRVRSERLDKDFVIGHVRQVFVEPGDLVHRGQLIARASDAGAPDGCHLHFEVRPVAGGYQSAVRPDRFLGLDQVR